MEVLPTPTVPRLLLLADAVECAVQLEKLTNNVAIRNPVPARGRVRDFLDEFDLDEKVGVVADGLAGDASVLSEFSFVELTPRREIE
jgi:hypothetical protein